MLIKVKGKEKPILFEEFVDSESIRVAKENPQQIIETFFHIVDKHNVKVPFIANEAQAKYERNRTPRDDILKARKEGFSSWIMAKFAVQFLFVENTWNVSISHESEATKRLFEKVVYYIENLAYEGRPIKVNLSSQSRQRLTYKHMNSMFYVGTAKSTAFGRGDTITNLHCSEIAFWDKAADLMTGLLNAVPDNFDTTSIVKESTANGFGTYHQIEWDAEKKGTSAFTPHFFGWHEDPTNKLDLLDFKARTGTAFEIVPEEKVLALEHSLTIEQLAWRRWKITSMPLDKKTQLTRQDKFKQEFPITDREAFISTGKPIFDSEMIKWYRVHYEKDPIRVGELKGWKPVIFIDNSLERLKLWAEPVASHQYVIAADVAEVNDFCYVTVWDRVLCEQVAEWHGRVDEFEFAAILYKMGMFFNKALVGVEKNNQGVAVVKKLDELKYENQYMRQSLDSVTKKVYNELGWRTDGKTKPIMVSDFNQMMTDRKVIIHSTLLLDEMETFVRNSRGSGEAQSGCNDDSVIGNCIAFQLYKIIPEPIKEKSVVTRGYRPNSSLHNYNLNRRKKHE